MKTGVQIILRVFAVGLQMHPCNLIYGTYVSPTIVAGTPHLLTGFAHAV